MARWQVEALIAGTGTQHSSGSTGSTTAVCWNPSETSRQQKPRQTSMRLWKDQTWPR